MNKESFVETLKRVVRDAGIHDTENQITNPPGTQPSPKLLEIAKWYRTLDAEAKSMVRQIIELSIDTGLFGLFCVLDGARVIENRDDRGELKLYYEKDGQQILLNEDKGDYLHDIFNDLTL